MAEEALRSTSLKANFHRLTRLLMRGGVQLLRETLDSIHSPADLPLKLADPAVQAQLRGARLTRPEWVCLNPSPGVYGKSNDFDITLIFKLFRTICGLTPPPGPRGWDDLPNDSDYTLVADLVRIKYFRNEIYGHCSTMEISDIDFIHLWEEISEALLRIARNISPAKRDQWDKSIDDLLRNPLTPDEKRCIEELETWYMRDMDLKNEFVKLRERLREELTEGLREELIGGLKEELRQGLREELRQGLRKELRQGLREELRSQRPACVVIQIKEVAGSEPTFLAPNLLLPEPEQAAGADDPEPNNPPDIAAWNVILSFKESVDLFFRYLSYKLHLLVRNDEVGSWHITVECSSLQVLEGLWEDYRSGHLNSVAQVMLITPQVLEKLGLTELKLKTFISKDQYEKVKKLLEASPGAEDKSEIQALPATVAKSISVGSTEPAYLAESEPGLAGFKTDSLGRMADSEASNEATSRDIPFEQAPVGEIHLWSICDDIGANWRDLGAVLKLESAFMANIETDFKECREKAWTVLRKWRQKNGKEATVGILRNALEKIERRDVVDKLLAPGKVEEGLIRARVQSGRIPKYFEQPMVDVKSLQKTIKEELQELKKILPAVLPTAKGEEERENTETRVESVEAVFKRVEKCLSDLLTEKSFKKGPEQDTTSVGKTCDQISEALRDLQENLKMIYENWKTEMAEQSQKDTEQTQGRENTQNKIIKEKETKIRNLEERHITLLEEYEKLQIRIEKTFLKEKEEVLEENKKVVEENRKIKEQIEKLKAKKEELESRLKNQIDLEELSRLKAEKCELSTQLIKLTKTASNSLKECQKLKEERKNLNFRSRVFLPIEKEFTKNCHGVIWFLKRDSSASSKLLASRSSEGPGKASDIFDHQKGTISGTEEKEGSWWSIDLGPSFRLAITHYSLRQGQRDGASALTRWQLEGSNDEINWKELETIHNKNDVQFTAPHPFYTGTWSVGGEVGAFRYFRIFQTGRNSSHKYGIYLSGIELFGMLLYI